MGNSHSSNLFNRPGAGIWLTIVTLTLSGVVWAIRLAATVENQQVQIAALQATVSARSQVLNLVESMQKDVTRLEARQEQIRIELDEFRSQREDYREVIGRESEHLEAVEERLERVDERVLHVERAFGWRAERGLGHNSPEPPR